MSDIINKRWSIREWRSGPDGRVRAELEDVSEWVTSGIRKVYRLVEEGTPEMSKSDYQRGFEDGRVVGASSDGPDRTMYEFLGGPKHGERIETSGAAEWQVALPLKLAAKYSLGIDLGINRTMPVGVYRRETVERNGKRRTVYYYQGER